MNKKEKQLLDAAREVVSDFEQYGEVLQHGVNGEYGTKSAIGLLSVAVKKYEMKHKETELDRKRNKCSVCNGTDYQLCDCEGKRLRKSQEAEYDKQHPEQ